MKERRDKVELAPGYISEPRFWDGVEQEIEALDPLDFLEFVEAGHPPVPPRPGFFEELRERLRGLVRRRSQT
jgi:hypothetical protein